MTERGGSACSPGPDAGSPAAAAVSPPAWPFPAACPGPRVTSAKGAEGAGKREREIEREREREKERDRERDR